MLYDAKIPLPTCVYAVKRVQESKDKLSWDIVNPGRNSSIYTALDAHASSFSSRSVESIVEKDYLGKYFVPRNMYVPTSLAQQARVTKWYLAGVRVPQSMRDYLAQFCERHMPGDYKVLTVDAIGCPNAKASSGVTIAWDPVESEFGWKYFPSGPNWDLIQEGTKFWLKLVEIAVPDTWLSKPISDLLSLSNPELEALAIERPVIRPESGPGHVRWARSSCKNLYILGRMLFDRVQSSVQWSRHRNYIGKASNTASAALRAENRDEFYFGTHGDDWIAWCPHCERWHSGDYSNWDLHITARQILAAYEAWFKVMSPSFNKEEVKWFYALAYFAIRAPTIWLWGRDDIHTMSVRRTLGKVRSGSGEFIIAVNNPVNRAGTEWAFRKAHDFLSAKGKIYPCRSRSWWNVFSHFTKQVLGWEAKPSAQLTHPHGFVACRAIHTRERSFVPVPTGTSVVRNFVSGAYDPQEYPNSSKLWMSVRLRELNATLAWLPNDHGLLEVIVASAEQAGITDPVGLSYSDADLARAVSAVVKLYSTRSYLDS